jgi:type IV pilus assembly protein PilB
MIRKRRNDGVDGPRTHAFFQFESPLVACHVVEPTNRARPLQFHTPRLYVCRMSSPPPRRRPKIGEFLVAHAFITAEQLRIALDEQKRWGGRLGRTLIELKFLAERDLTKALSQLYGFPVFDFATSRAGIPRDALLALPPETCEKYDCIPVDIDRKHKTLMVAMAEPMNLRTLDELAFRAGHKIAPFITSLTDVAREIRRHYYGENVDAQPVGQVGSIANYNEKVFSFVGTRAELTGEAALAPSAAVAKGESKKGISAVEIDKEIRRQLAALKTLVNLLIEKGILTRDEFLDRLKRGDDF